MEVPQKLERQLPYNLANPLLGIQKKQNNYLQEISYSHVIVTLFTVGKTRKQPKYLSTDDN